MYAYKCVHIHASAGGLTAARWNSDCVHAHTTMIFIYAQIQIHTPVQIFAFARGIAATYGNPDCIQAHTHGVFIYAHIYIYIYMYIYIYVYIHIYIYIHTYIQIYAFAGGVAATHGDPDCIHYTHA